MSPTVRRVRSRVAAALPLLLLLSLLPSSAAAQSDDERARGHFRAGASYFDQRRFELAAREFEEAYRLSERPALLLNLATTYERMGRHERAATYLARYLEADPDTPERRTLEARLEALRERVAEESAPEEEADAAPPAAAPTRPPEADEGGGPSGLLIGSLASLGAAVAFGGVALGTGLVSNDRLAQLEAACGPEQACPPELDPVIDEGETMATVSTVFLFAGVAAAVAGATLLALDLTSGDDDQPTARASVWGSPTGAGARLDVVF
jgi:tetratricopeptide (TPR) repeat protein